MPYEELKLIDAQEIFYGIYEHPPMLIDGLLTSGLTVFSGDSKIGKSWLVLWLCLKLGKGEPVWGIPVGKRSVIYLALEDREWRIQDRMHLLTDEPPDNLHFGFSCGVIGKELEDQIVGALQKYPDTSLIFIDTLQMVRENASGNVNAYSKDYKDLAALKKISDDKKISIVLIHHTKKEKTERDPFSQPNGSMALTGAADTSWVLSKDDRFGETAKLSITGRDVEDKQLRLKLNGVIWECVDVLDKKRILLEKIPRWIFRIPAMILSDGWFQGTVTDLLQKLNITDLTPSRAGKQLSQFAQDVLEPLEMQIMQLRRASGRYYMIREKPGDGSDGHDANWRSEKLASLRKEAGGAEEEADAGDASVSLPETPSQPSLPSSSSLPDGRPPEEHDSSFRADSNTGYTRSLNP